MTMPYRSYSLLELLQLAEEDPNGLAAAIANRILGSDDTIETLLSGKRSDLNWEFALEEIKTEIVAAVRNLSYDELPDYIEGLLSGEEIGEKIGEEVEGLKLTINDILEKE